MSDILIIVVRQTASRGLRDYSLVNYSCQRWVWKKNTVYPKWVACWNNSSSDVMRRNRAREGRNARYYRIVTQKKNETRKLCSKGITDRENIYWRTSRGNSLLREAGFFAPRWTNPTAFPTFRIHAKYIFGLFIFSYHQDTEFFEDYPNL